MPPARAPTTHTKNKPTNKRHCRYGGGYSASSPTVRAFFKVVAGFDAQQRGALLRFVTSCSRAPLGGFAFLEPPLTLQKVPCAAPPLAFLAGSDVERLPTAGAVCVRGRGFCVCVCACGGARVCCSLA